jgi:hypothetical protein
MADDDAHDDIGIENGFAQGDDEDFKAAIKAREAQCTPQLLRESPGQALKIALQDPPYNTRTMAVKELSAMVAVKALLAIKEAEASQARAAPPRPLSWLAPPRTRRTARAGLAPASSSRRAPNSSPFTPRAQRESLPPFSLPSSPHPQATPFPLPPTHEPLPHPPTPPHPAPPRPGACCSEC